MNGFSSAGPCLKHEHVLVRSSDRRAGKGTNPQEPAPIMTNHTVRPACALAWLAPNASAPRLATRRVLQFYA